MVYFVWYMLCEYILFEYILSGIYYSDLFCPGIFYPSTVCYNVVVCQKNTSVMIADVAGTCQVGLGVPIEQVLEHNSGWDWCTHRASAGT